ncbi:Lipid-binding putative hydrolase [compost metagenome]
MAGEYKNTLAVPAANTDVSLLEGKIMLNASTQPSKTVADSIYVKYKTAVNGQIYIVKGHRRTQWPEDQK